jgi:hypothetical protein
MKEKPFGTVRQNPRDIRLTFCSDANKEAAAG